MATDNDLAFMFSGEQYGRFREALLCRLTPWAKRPFFPGNEITFEDLGGTVRFRLNSPMGYHSLSALEIQTSAQQVRVFWENPQLFWRSARFNFNFGRVSFVENDIKEATQTLMELISESAQTALSQSFAQSP